MFCPECGEVIGAGPLDLRAARHANDSIASQRAGPLRRLIARIFRRSDACNCGRPTSKPDRGE